MASVKPVDAKNPQSPGYGLALAQFGPLYGHTGELPGCNVRRRPARKITIVVWAATAPSPTARPATTWRGRSSAELYKTDG